MPTPPRSTKKPSGRQEIDQLIEKTRTLAERKLNLTQRILKSWVENDAANNRATRPQALQPKFRKAG